MACQLAERVGIKVKQVLTHDDISAGIGADINDRRGLAGCVPLYKILGAAAKKARRLQRTGRNRRAAITTTSLLWPLPCALVRILVRRYDLRPAPGGIMEIGMGLKARRRRWRTETACFCRRYGYRDGRPAPIAAQAEGWRQDDAYHQRRRTTTHGS